MTAMIYCSNNINTSIVTSIRTSILKYPQIYTL